MLKHGQKIRNKPAIDSSMSERELRKRLIMEEAQEACDAIDANDIVLLADGIADSLYVQFGCALTFGIPIEAVFAEVHRSNMTKPKFGQIEGKVQKGDYSRPRVDRILELYNGRE